MLTLTLTLHRTLTLTLTLTRTLTLTLTLSLTLSLSPAGTCALGAGWQEAAQLCESSGARLCTQAELVRLRLRVS